MRTRRLIACGLFALSFAAGGCEQRVPKDQLGHVIFEVPAVPGSDKPPPTPELDKAEHPLEGK